MCLHRRSATMFYAVEYDQMGWWEGGGWVSRVCFVTAVEWEKVMWEVEVVVVEEGGGGASCAGCG